MGVKSKKINDYYIYWNNDNDKINQFWIIDYDYYLSDMLSKDDYNYLLNNMENDDVKIDKNDENDLVLEINNRKFQFRNLDIENNIYYHIFTKY